MRQFIAVALCIFAIASFCGPSYAQLFGAKQIDLIHNNGDPDGSPDWHLAEIQAFQTTTATNVALSSNGGVASVPVGGTAFGTVPGDAIDNNLDQTFGGGSVWHSDGFGAGSTFRVDLAAPTDLDTIDLFGRSDCCQGRDDDLTLKVFDDMGAEIFSQDLGIPDGNQFISVPVQGGTAPAIPEPASIAIWSLIGLGLAGFGYYRVRRKK